MFLPIIRDLLLARIHDGIQIRVEEGLLDHRIDLLEIEAAQAAAKRRHGNRAMSVTEHMRDHRIQTLPDPLDAGPVLPIVFRRQTDDRFGRLLEEWNVPVKRMPCRPDAVALVPALAPGPVIKLHGWKSLLEFQRVMSPAASSFSPCVINYVEPWKCGRVCGVSSYVRANSKPRDGTGMQILQRAPFLPAIVPL